MSIIPSAKKFSEQIKAKLRNRVNDDPGVYPDAETELRWRLVRKYPESAIEIAKLRFGSGTITIDEDDVSHVTTDIVEKLRNFRNDTSIERSQAFNTNTTVTETTVVNFSEVVTSQSTQTVVLNASVNIKGVFSAGASATNQNTLTTQLTKGMSTTNATQTVRTVSETLRLLPKTILSVRIRRVQQTSIYPFDGTIMFTGTVEVKCGFNNLKEGIQAIEYVLPKEKDRSFAIRGQIVSKLSSRVDVEYIETPIPQDLSPEALRELDTGLAAVLSSGEVPAFSTLVEPNKAIDGDEE